MLSRAEVVQLELPFVGEYNVGAPGFSEGISFMDVVGFSPYDIVEQHRLPTTGKQLFQIDVLFLRKTSPIMQRVQAEAPTLRSLVFGRASLEQVFLSLTGDRGAPR